MACSVAQRLRPISAQPTEMPIQPPTISGYDMPPRSTSASSCTRGKGSRRTIARKTGGSVGRPAATIKATASSDQPAMFGECQQQNGSRPESAHRHHGEGLDKHTDRRHRRVDPTAPHQPGPDDHHQGLARHVLAQVSNVVRAKRLTEPGRCPRARSRKSQKTAHGRMLSR